MKVIDPGHRYLLDSLDGDFPQEVVFVKREGERYPGNVGSHPGNVGSHPGTTTQDVLRALIDRLEYVNRQIPCEETAYAAARLADAVYLLECRAARIHGRPNPTPEAAVRGEKCPGCGHVGCDGHCRRHRVEEDATP